MKSITNINKELQWIHLLDTQLDYEDTLMRSTKNLIHEIIENSS